MHWFARHSTVALVVLLAVMQARGESPMIIDQDTSLDTYIDGTVHIVPGLQQTTVTALPGAYFSGEVLGNSILDIVGGHFHGAVRDSGVIRMRSGEMEIGSFGASTVNFTDGYSEVSSACDTSIWNIAGGHIEFLHAHDSSNVTISDGRVDMVIGHDSSHISITGGDVDLIWAGDPDGTSWPELDANIVMVTGGSFNYPYGSILDRTGRLQGVLANGDPIDAVFEIHGQASIILVPEPSMAMLAAIGMLGLLAHRRNIGK